MAGCTIRDRVVGLVAAAVTALTLAPGVVEAADPPPGRPFAPVFEGVVEGDLLLAGNSNLGGTDVDGDRTPVCAFRAGANARDPICTDNSSSADVDVPTGARVVAARLYVETTLPAAFRPVRAALDGPGPGFAYAALAADPPTTAPDGAAPPVPKLYEATGGDAAGAAVVRQAVWDVTAFVAATGGGRYTVADIVSTRVAPNVRHASWALAVLYERDPNTVAPDEVDRTRFAPRLVSWHDGFQHLANGVLDVPVRGLPGDSPFAKGFHVVAGGRAGRSDNLLLDGRPLGNSTIPGDVAPPAGVAVGTDPDCNTVTDVQNGSICVLGTATAAGDGVDIDVVRIPGAHVRAAGAEAVVRVQLTGAESLAPGLLAVAVDLPGGAP